MSAPLPFRWDGEAMRPLRPRDSAEADRRYVVGEVYRLEPIEDRSAASHRHYFAAINEAWASLPDGLAERMPTPEHLRKYALIKAGWSDSRSFVAASKAGARDLAAFVRPMDEFSIVTAEGAVVTVYTAKSQSMRAMGKQAFQKSKDDVLAVIADLLGTTPDRLPTEQSA